MPACRVCQKKFTVHPEDKKILKGLDVPEPTLCAEDSHRRRMAWRNENHIYKRPCEKCTKPTVTMFSPQSYVHVYCRPCWFSDNWNPMDYGRDYDANRPFFEQFFELLKNVPHYSLYQPHPLTNCEYTNFVIDSKDCYLTYSGSELDNVAYSSQINWSRDCADDLQTYNSELLYECVNARHCYRSAWLTRCEKVTESYLSRDLFDCHNCFGSVNLKHKRYYWFNEPLSKEEYNKRLATALGTRKNFIELVKKFTEHEKHYPVEFAVIQNSSNVEVDGIEHCNNVRNSFNLINDDNCGDCFRMLRTKDSMRINHTIDTERSYEFNSCIQMYASLDSLMSERCNFSAYCFLCEDSEELLGCVGLRNKKFCILNKQYDEASYRALKKQIIEKMKTAGEWGEFLPEKYAPHAYNETIAQDNFPLTPQAAQERGLRWQETETIHSDTKTFDLSRTETAELKDDALDNIIACQNCRAPYKLQKIELHLLKLLRLPPPLTCPRCRYQKRLERGYKPQAYNRICMCEINTHNTHAGTNCSTHFKTTYAPDRSEKIFCSPCYQAVIQ